MSNEQAPRDAPSVNFERYERKTAVQHILDRPDMYCGSSVRGPTTAFVLGALVGGSPRLVERLVSVSTGLCNLCDELLVNACDRVQEDETCDQIRVSWSKEGGWFSVHNTGTGIPVAEHPEYKCLVPELVFGQLRTSTNYGQGRKSTVGGRNGLGSKLCNVMGSKFRVETSSTRTGHRFVGVWSGNMSNYDGGKVSKAAKRDFTKVTFWPDWSRFDGVTGWDDDHLAWLGKRVVDAAGTVHRRTRVYLNKVRVRVGTFKEYVALYLADKSAMVYEQMSPRWGVAVATSPSSAFRQVSFVNNLCTSGGGTHVEYVTGQVVRGLVASLREKNKELTIRPSMIRQRLWVFINSFVEDPSFRSQTKEELGTQPTAFGSDPRVPRAFVANILRKKLVHSALDFARFAERKVLKKTDGRKTRSLLGIPKLEDANKAGTAQSSKCTLIITEGDSAKALAVSGLTVVGRDHYGVFPLKGKFLNVREASVSQLRDNAELASVKKILGLQQDCKYEDVSSLRYGHVMLMADQDHDGSHIKGLFLNMLATFWPELLRLPGFVSVFITPVVRVTRGPHSVDFFSIHEYNRWNEEHHQERGWAYQYYKGLGTSTSKDARAYFSNLPRHVVRISPAGEGDLRCMQMAFERAQADQRKAWLARSDMSVGMDFNVDEMTLSDFVNKELVHFSHASNLRAIPTTVDGLKPCQRKILYTALRKGITKSTKVVDLQSAVSDLVSYHHGEVSMQQAIHCMAQNYVGSNNVNLLVPDGQFGTRAMGGKDCASARYTLTRLEPWTPLLFPAGDFAVYTRARDDGRVVEPVTMPAVLPLSLVNGAHGLGTGWSTDVPPFNPEDVHSNLLRHMRGEPMVPMTPWYRGFSGTVSRVGRHRFRVTGTASRAGPLSVDVTELPVGRWTSSYKARLEKMQGAGRIDSFVEHHTEHQVHFSCHLGEGSMAEAEGDLIAYFGLKSDVTTSNMVLFGADGLRRYDSELDILRDYYPARLSLYESRLRERCKELEGTLEALSWRVRFIELVCSGEIEMRNRARKDVHDALRAFDIPGSQWASLLALPLSSVTLEVAEELREGRSRSVAELAEVRGTLPTQLWERELSAFIDSFRRSERAREAEFTKGREQAVAMGGGAVQSKRKRAVTSAPHRKRPRANGAKR